MSTGTDAGAKGGHMMADSVRSPFEDWSSGKVVDEHTRQGTNTFFVSEMLRRLMIQLSLQAAATDELTKSIRRLNVWLLAFTIAIFVATLVLVGVELGRIHR